MRLHVELRTQKNAEQGIAAEAAREAAERQFGNRTALSEEAREAWIPPALEGFVQDLRYAWRVCGGIRHFR